MFTGVTGGSCDNLRDDFGECRYILPDVVFSISCRAVVCHHGNHSVLVCGVRGLSGGGLSCRGSRWRAHIKLRMVLTLWVRQVH